jgi:CO/xanthine dehydrogenase Mo-binding subunit
MAAADVRVAERLVIRRGGGQSMEGRGVAAARGADGILTVWSSTQCPHVVQRGIAEMLDLPLRQVRVLCGDIGGGFGTKVYLYPEEIVVPLLALRTGRAVRWVEDRREHFLSSIHEGEQVHEVELGLRRDGTILALRDRFTAEAGADLPWGIVVPALTAQSMPGPYRVPNYAFDLRVYYLNKVAAAPVRGAGRPQAAFVMDRILDQAARALGMEPAELRRKNLIPADAFPYTTGLVGRDGLPLQYDSGNYPEQLRKLLTAAGDAGLRAEQERLRAAGRLVGIGIGFGVEATSLGPLEGATVRVEPSGQVHVIIGSSSQGQGHETTMAQLCAGVLGVPLEAVTVTTGRTDDLPYGTGTFASRIGAVAGTTVAMAASAVRAKAIAAAAHLLEASTDDLTVEDGKLHVRGAPGKAIALGEVARVLSGPFPGIKFGAPVSAGLEATEYFQPESPAYAASAHLAMVEVEPEEGAVRLLRHITVHDCGRLINPLIVEGQVHGGVAHGISDTLFEDLQWDASGQLLTTSYMDYLLPTACDVPWITVDHVETPTPLNPLGVKGAGEGGTIGSPSAIAGAVEDALEPLGVRVREVPIIPSKLRAWIADAQALAGAGARLR